MLNKFLKGMGLKHERPTLPLAAYTPAPTRLAPRDVTDEDFAEIVLQSDKLTVVDFWAEWCEPCQVMSAYVGFLANDYVERVLVVALDVDENTETSEKYKIMGLPTLLFFRQGQEVARVVGVIHYEELKQKVDEWL